MLAEFDEHPDVMDEGDLGAAYQSRANAAGVAAARAGMPDASATPDDSATDCEWCGDEIPAGRREAWPGVRLCAECQAQRERLPGRVG